MPAAQTSIMAESQASMSNGSTPSLLARLQLFSPRLTILVVALTVSFFNFGFDQSNFSGLQTFPTFLERFGTYDQKHEEYSLSSEIQSIMVSTPYIGKLLGTWSAGVITERIGRKKMLAIIALLGYIGASLEVSATTVAQFTVGRCMCYYMAGVTAGAVPYYLAECAPSDLRGLVGTQLQLWINIGVLCASLVNLGASSVTSSIQWRIPLLVQYGAPTLILALYPWTVESPRWSLAHGHPEKAFQSLRLLKKSSVSDEAVLAEVEAIKTGLNITNNREIGSFKDVFNSANRRRTGIACLVMFGQQSTGQAFGSQYGVFFYKSQNISHPFLLQVSAAIVGLVCLFSTSLILDSFGRRVVLLAGGCLQAVFLFAVGGIGTLSNPSEPLKKLMVACLILDGASYNVSWAPLSYLTIGEVSTQSVREKTAALGVSVSIITAFVVTFTLPYLLNQEYAGLGARVGFIYASLAVLMVIAAWFIVPELKGRTLEEVDELFARKLPPRKFKHAEVTALRAETFKRDESTTKADVTVSQVERVT